MKNPLLLSSLWALCLALGSQSASAQSSFNSGAAGSSPFGQFHSPPASPQAAATPDPATQAAYGSAAVNPNAAAGFYSNEPVEPNHKLNRGDILSYRVVEDRDSKPPEPLVVTDSGEVNIPLIGPIPATGKSVTQLSSEVKARLEREYYYHATVIMGLERVAPRPSRGRVYMSGAVRTEGPVELPLDETLTVSKAVIKAGGAKDFGDLAHVKVLRKANSGKPIIVNVKTILKGKPEGDIALEPGDTVVIPEKLFNL